MFCPTCGTKAADGTRFCGSCGADLGDSAQGQQPAGESVPEQTTPMPAAVQVPPPAMPSQPQPTQTQPAQSAPPPLPAPKGGGGTMALLSILIVLMLAGIGVGGYFGWKAISGGGESDTDPLVSTSDESGTEDSGSTSQPSDQGDVDGDGGSVSRAGYATPEEAVMAEYPSDWVYDFLVNEGSYREYVIGPPNSEYLDVLVVEQQADGTWLVTDGYAFDMGDIDDSPGDTMTPQDESTFLVGDFLYAIKENRADDAHALTVEPFSDDPASAQFANGDLKSIEVLSAVVQSDGYTVHVRSREVWAWGTEEWIYVCVPTEIGYRISELRMP